MPKNFIFGRLPDGQTNRKNRALERQGPQKGARIALRRGDFWDWGPRGASRAVLNNKTTGSIKGDVVCHADGRWPGEFLGRRFGRNMLVLRVWMVLRCSQNNGCGQCKRRWVWGSLEQHSWHSNVTYTDCSYLCRARFRHY